MRSDRPKLIVMLTYNDRTVENAPEIFEQCQNSLAQFWGMKEEGLPLHKMKALYSAMRAAGKTTALEVVAYSEKECLEGAEMALQCGCDILMGTVYSDAVNRFCQENGLKYMPFVGEVTGRPSILEGSADGMIARAGELIKKGVYGFDLLGYRYTGDATALIKRFVREVDAPVCVAGSVNSVQRLDEVRAAGAWAFTIGSAFFEKRFGRDFSRQIDTVCRYIEA